MNFTVIAEYLKRAVRLTEHNTGKDLALPTLSSLLISAQNGNISVTGTNLEIGVVTTRRGNIQEQGKVAIPVKVLSSFISTIQKDEKVVLKSSHTTDILIQSEKQKTIIKGYPTDDFPPFPEIKNTVQININQKNLLPALSRCIISSSKNTIKPELASVFLSVKGSGGTVASTDSFRLFEEKIPISTNIEDKQITILLPIKTCEEIKRLIEDNDNGDVVISVGDGEADIFYVDTHIYSRLTQGNFPDYRQIIPTKFTTTCTVDKNNFLGHLKRASIFTSKLNSVVLRVNQKEKKIDIESSNKDIGEHHSSLGADTEGDDLEIVFNNQYLIEGIEGYNEKRLTLGFNGDGRPLAIRPESSSGVIYVVMPMKGTS